MARLKIRSILAATDLSDASDPILRTAASLARSLDAELHVIHAFDERQLPPPQKGPTFQGRVAEAEQLLSQQIQRSIADPVRVASRELVVYEAGKAIVDRAAEVAADLIVFGPHRRRSFADAYLGSTADHVVQRAGADCLIVRGGLTLPLGRVVVTTDLSDAARPAIIAAADWVGAFGGPDSELFAVHVLEPSLGVAVSTGALEDEIAEAVRETASVPADVRGIVLEGEFAGDVLVSFAEREGVALLVIATSGYGALKRVLIGSVAASVAREAPCSVLLVRTNEAQVPPTGGADVQTA